MEHDRRNQTSEQEAGRDGRRSRVAEPAGPWTAPAPEIVVRERVTLPLPDGERDRRTERRRAG